MILRVYIRESLSVDTKSIPIENKNQMELYQTCIKRDMGSVCLGGSDTDVDKVKMRACTLVAEAL